MPICGLAPPGLAPPPVNPPPLTHPTCAPPSPLPPCSATNSSYQYMSGTSMASPVVSGAAALLFALKPTATVEEVRCEEGGAGAVPASAALLVPG